MGKGLWVKTGHKPDIGGFVSGMVDATGRTRMEVMTCDYDQSVHEGSVPDRTYDHKFGSNSAIGTSYSVIATSGTYQTPMTPQSLRIKSDQAADTVAGTGLRHVVVTGIVAGWVVDSETVDMNGTTPVNLTKQFLRVYRIAGAALGSGTYATLSASSQAGTITLENLAGTDTWGMLDVSGGLGLGQSLIGAYSVPMGHTAYIKRQRLLMQSNKEIDVLFFTRENADRITAPYGTMKVKEAMFSLDGDSSFAAESILDEVTGPADLGYLGKVSVGTASIDVSMEILVVNNDYVPS